MPLIGNLTRPENAAELRQRLRILRELREKGGCAACQHRDPTVMAWGRSVCRAYPARSFPACTTDGRAPAFLLDETMLTRGNR